MSFLFGTPKDKGHQKEMLTTVIKNDFGLSEMFSTKNLTLLGSLMTQMRRVCCMTGRLGGRWVRGAQCKGQEDQHIPRGQQGAQLFRRYSRMSKAGSGIIRGDTQKWSIFP